MNLKLNNNKQIDNIFVPDVAIGLSSDAMLSSDWWVGLSASCDTKGAGHSSFCNWGTNSFNLSHVVCMRLL